MQRPLALLLLLPLLGACADDAPADDCSDGTMAGPVWVRSAADLDALEGCRTVQGSLYLWSTNLESLAPLASLETVEGTLSIQKNAALRDARGLEKLERIDGCLEVRDNPALTTLDGLESLGSIGTCLSIGTSDAKEGRPHGNDRLESLDGLASLTFVGLFVSIENNARLADVDGLGAVRSVGGDLSVVANAGLGSVAGLMSLDDFSGDHVAIAKNPALPSCEAESLAAQLGAADTKLDGNDENAVCSANP